MLFSCLSPRVRSSPPCVKLVLWGNALIPVLTAVSYARKQAVIGHKNVHEAFCMPYNGSEVPSATATLPKDISRVARVKMSTSKLPNMTFPFPLGLPVLRSF